MPSAPAITTTGTTRDLPAIERSRSNHVCHSPPPYVSAYAPPTGRSWVREGLCLVADTRVYVHVNDPNAPSSWATR